MGCKCWVCQEKMCAAVHAGARCSSSAGITVGQRRSAPVSLSFPGLSRWLWAMSLGSSRGLQPGKSFGAGNFRPFQAWDFWGFWLPGKESTELFSGAGLSDSEAFCFLLLSRKNRGLPGL